MHVPDGFFDTTTTVATGVVAVAAVGLSLRGARRELDERTAPLTGVVSAFIFAVQMLNFPVMFGTSGHLLGGVLAAVLVGPWTAVLVMTVVLGVQAFVFADGGTSALGINITLMGVIAVAVGFALVKLALRFLPKVPKSVVPAAAFAALISVPVTAIAFSLLYAVGGAEGLSIVQLTAAMGGVHVLIGIGEAVITGITVATVIGVRPDLVYAARALIPARDLAIRSGQKSGASEPSDPEPGQVPAHGQVPEPNEPNEVRPA